METAFIIVWGLALLAIAALLATLVCTLQRRTLQVESASGPAAFVPFNDALLFEYGQESVRSTANGRVVVRIKGISWDTAWQNDMLRLEVSSLDPGGIMLPDAWGQAEVVAAYILRAYRMTDMGTDLPVSLFVKPIEVALFTDKTAAHLRVLVQQRAAWIPAPTAEIDPQALGDPQAFEGQSWAAALLNGPGWLCLVKSNPVQESQDPDR